MNKSKAIIKRLFDENLIWVILLGIALVGLTVDGFLSTRNLINILWAATPLGCMVMGMFFVMLVGGLDLSIESNFAFSSCVAIILITTSPIPPLLGVPIALVVGVLVGFVNGLISVKLRVNPFLTTLAMLLTLRGAVIYLIPEGVYGLPPEITFLGSYKIAGIFPVAIIILVLVYVVGYIITDYTSFGKNLFAIGNNEQAAFVAGINVSRVRILTFVLAGFFAALGGIIEVGRLKSIVADLGSGSIMLVFAATILGGTALSGGEGKVSGIFGGVLVLGVIENLLNLFGVEPSIRQMVYGIVLLGAIYLASLQKRVK